MRDSKGLCDGSRWERGGRLKSGGRGSPALLASGGLCVGRGGVLSGGEILVACVGGWAGEDWRGGQSTGC